MIRIHLLEDIDKTLPARDVDTFVTRIVIEIVHVGDAR